MESYSINIFQYYGISEGYTEVTKNFNLFKLKLNKYFNSSFEIQDNFRPNIPCFLAYEKSTINLNSDYLLIFDVPPESNIVQLQQNFIGDRVASYDFNKKFLCDIVEVASNLKLKIVLKPKYSLNNYSEEYKSLLSYLQNNFGLNILNPYVRASSIINNANSVISAPYTSTESFAKYVSIRSCFYVPDSYNFHKEFSSVINSSIIITGRESLRQFLIS
jgi:polysaccharide biosynthesis PFTS motif protein